MLAYPFMQNALLAGAMVAILAPVIGIFLVLRRYAMMGDTLAHASLAGVAIGIVIGVTPTITSILFTTLAAFLIEFLRDRFKRYAEILMSVVMTLSVGIAIVLVSSGKANTNINQYLFGSILTVTRQDLLLVLIVTLVTLLAVKVFYHELIYTTFDEDGALVSRVKVKRINYIFALLMGLAISVSIRITGVLVISSLIVLPVASAMQFKKGFRSTLLLGVLIGLLDVLLGLILSYTFDSAPGGTIALMSVVTMLGSLLLNPFSK
ncbi:metal ABC transporter permease [Proteiniclasticum sp. BAD-10]|uniref:Metal ABC transporter permease n=1 Tax=Proteiniclasticum sediminis TaxID=2804028 RepID=A0A941CNC4_9CLOT|nr:metal ABC transporter permease [Proteiniclasticum sediminis]MBR0575782.1 metal ABC transporter permease [Proteiniclasticum sediminis]